MTATITVEFSLLSIVGKAFAHMALNRFKAGRSTIGMIFSLCQVQEKYHEHRQPLFITFIDMTKAFDLVGRKGLFTLLQRIGCPLKLPRMITSIHEGMQGTVQYDGSSMDPFPIRNGVKQGCILAQHSLASSLCCLLTPSVSQKAVYTSTPEATEASSALHASE